MKSKIILFTIAIVAILLAIGTEIRMLNFKRSMEKQMNRLSEITNSKLSDVNKELNDLKVYFEPNGIVEKYIISNNFLKKNMDDLDKILTDFQSNSRTGYLQIYIIGSENVWCAFKNPEGKYIFQGNLNPGLNPEKFYFFKSPSINTKYTYTIDYCSSFKTGNMDKVYFLIQEPGQSRIKKHPEEKIENITKALNLYIPTITGK
ncbi:hypothetical protein OSSY52_09750 [Tepiditoga spiralis]|uniref:Uncharacterized protein n=1 Tax=Tepiditoga spiralis TaxID=2108365 RepID=A0A7G1G6R1_9BACT|nr:hypothetical protein [Tepiditoga spiralis]BBE30834.1 hypothetical protein OSSY52_09750 [Tepiditoga spiralis]